MKHSRKAAGEDAYTDEAHKRANGFKKSTRHDQLRNRPSAALEKPLMDKEIIIYETFEKDRGFAYFRHEDVVAAVKKLSSRVSMLWLTQLDDRGYHFTADEVHKVIEEVFGKVGK